MRDRICRYKVVLKFGLDCSLNLGNLAHGLFDLGTGGDVAQRNPCACTRRIAGRCDLGQWHVGDHPQNHRVFGRDMCPERTGQNHPVHPVDGHFIHQKPRPSIERGFCQLNRTNISLRNGDPRPALCAGIMDQIGMGPPLGHRAGCASCLGRADQS